MLKKMQAFGVKVNVHNSTITVHASGVGKQKKGECEHVWADSG